MFVKICADRQNLCHFETNVFSTDIFTSFPEEYSIIYHESRVLVKTVANRRNLCHFDTSALLSHALWPVERRTIRRPGTKYLSYVAHGTKSKIPTRLATKAATPRT